MKASEDINICKNHGTWMTYHGDECPWCTFKAEMIVKLQAEYRRGFEDGVRAADIEYAKKEALNADNHIEPRAAQSPRGGPGAGGGDSEGVEVARGVDEHRE